MTKPSVVRSESCGSVKVTWLDRELVLEQLRRAAARLVAADPRVLAVGLVGSLARGTAVPGSDADVVVLLRGHGRTFLERLGEYAAAFEAVGIAVDVFPYRWDEAERGIARPGFLRTALRQVVHLAGDAAAWRRLVISKRPQRDPADRAASEPEA